jgi:hypothetical protein
VLVCDNFLQLDGATSPPTGLTTAILSAGAHGADSAIGNFAVAGTALSLEAPQTNMTPRADIFVRGGVGRIAMGGTFRSIGIDHSSSGMTATWTVDNGGARISRAVSVWGWFKCDIPDQAPSPNLYDICGMFSGLSGEFCMMQFNSAIDSGLGNLPYGLEIETNPGATTTHTTGIHSDPNPPVILWYNIRADYAYALSRLAVFDVNDRLIGIMEQQQSSVDASGNGDYVNRVVFGQGESGVASGRKSYLSCLGIDYTQALFPVGPRGVVPYNPNYDRLLKSPVRLNTPINRLVMGGR